MFSGSANVANSNHHHLRPGEPESRGPAGRIEAGRSMRFKQRRGRSRHYHGVAADDAGRRPRPRYAVIIDTPSRPATGRDRPERWPLRAPPRLDRPRSDSRPPRRRGRARVPIRRPGRPPAAIGRNGGRRAHRDRPRRGRREMTVMRCATGHGRRRRFTDRRAKREYSHQRRQRGGRPLPARHRNHRATTPPREGRRTALSRGFRSSRAARTRLVAATRWE